MNTLSQSIAQTLRTATLAAGLSGLLTAPATAQVGIAWIEQTRGVSVAVDANDNVFTVDYEQALGAEMVLTKRDSSGALQWTAFFDQTDTTRWERASWVDVDSRGDAVICGTSMSGYSGPVEAASIVAKFRADGTRLWRRVFETEWEGSSVSKCLIDAQDNIYVLGKGNGPLGMVARVKKFAPDGTPLWSWFDGAGIGLPVNFKFTPEGNIVISARSVFGSVNGYAKIDRNGNTLWSYPGVYSLTVGDAAGDLLGNTYLVHGEYVTTNPRTVVKKLGLAGELIWQRFFALSGFRIDVGSDDQAVVSGFPNSGTPGAAFIKVNQNGNQVWQNLDADGALAVLAHSRMLLDSGNNAYLAAGTMSEMAVTRVNADGSTGWTQTVPFGYASSIALGNTDASVYVVGGTTARLVQGNVPGLPRAPSNLRTEALTATSASLRWDDNSVDESGFTLERCAGTLVICGASGANWAVRTTTGAGITSFTDLGLTANTTYSWRVKAFNAVGSSGYSNVLAATTLAPAPAAPTNLTAEARLVKSKARVQLSWVDNASNETGFRVERCRGSACTSFATVVSLPVNSRSYTDTAVARRTAYRYRVIATGSGANSAYSNVVSVTTP